MATSRCSYLRKSKMNSRYPSSRILFALAVALGFTTSACCAEPSFTVKNDTDRFVELWRWRHTLSTWKVFDLPAGKSLNILPLTPGLSTLVAREPPNRDYQIGPYNLTEIAAKNSNPVLRLVRVMQARTVREFVYDSSCRPRSRYRQIHFSVIAGEWMGIDEKQSNPK